jgi:hypothetical protein
MQVPPAFRRADDAALLTGLVDPMTGDGTVTDDGTAERIVLDGRRLAYLVAHGRADVFAVSRPIGPEPGRRHFLGTFGQGAVVPSTTALSAWQLVLAPASDTRVRPLSTGRLRGIGYGGVGDLAEPADLLVPAPRAVSVLVAALARGLDAALCTLSDALHAGEPPPHAMAIGPGQIISLDAGAAVTSDGDVSWLRVAGGHARRNGEDAAVFGGAEPALLCGRDWIVVDGPATAESTSTADLLATGHLPAALDQHMVLTLRAIDGRITEDGDPAGGVTEPR